MLNALSLLHWMVQILLFTHLKEYILQMCMAKVVQT